MGSTSKKTVNNVSKNTVDVPDWLKKFQSDSFGDLFKQSRQNSLNDYNNWLNHEDGTIYGNIYHTANGDYLNQVDPNERKLVDENINSSNNAIMRQFDSAGRGNSFSNLHAVEDNTNNLNTKFMAENIDRNRNAMQQARQLYLNGLLNAQNNVNNANNNILNIIRQFSGNTNDTTETITDHRSALQNILSIFGAFGSNFGKGFGHWLTGEDDKGNKKK